LPPEAIPITSVAGHGDRPRLAIELGQYSSAGRKAENQDFHGSLQPDGPELELKGIACCIADGISTSIRGAEAAEIACKSFLTDYFCTPDGWSVRRSGETVITAANSWMHAQNAAVRPREEGEDRERAGLICTLSALVLKSRVAHIFHVGDSQIARIVGDRLEALTSPHRIELGGGQSYLGRAMGANDSLAVDYAQVRATPGDVFLLTTDGVHECVADQALVGAVQAAATLDDAAADIARLALAAGSEDNLTVQIVRVESLPAGEVQDLLGLDLRLPPAPVLHEGQSLDGYRVIERLHAGSRSHVYLVRDETTQADFALKVLSSERAGDPEAVAALLLEEWVARRLSHPNLLAAGPASGPRSHAYCVMALAEGTSLHRHIAEHSPFDLQHVRQVVRQLSMGLEAMHRRGVLHRDLRPHNVMVDADGHATIIDFGSAQVAGLDELAPRAFEDAAFAGTMQYSAPEVFLGQPASPASDVFSLGVIAYQMATGDLPYGPRVSAARTPAAQKKLAYVPASERNPDIPPWFDGALAKALAVDPRYRYATPAELVQDLANPNHSLPSVGSTPLVARGSAHFWRAVALVLAAALIASLWFHLI
tara:strand:+ start:2110 stop:3897 length:1788 start_codon:yes stop_codon:yes gene_type:complete